MLILTTSQFGSMPGGDHCAVWGCDNDRRYPEKLKILPHVGMFRFYSPKNKQDVLSWSRAINRDKFKVTMSTKVCSNHFAQGYRNPQCRTPTLYMKGYDCEDKLQRPAPKIRITEVSNKKTRKRKQSGNGQLNDGVEFKKVALDDDIVHENIDLDTAPLSPASEGPVACSVVDKRDVATQTEYKSQEEEKRAYFIHQATCPKSCYRCTGLSRPKLDLVFEFLEPKATEIHYWRGSKSTKTLTKKRKTKKKATCVNDEGVLSKREQFILTLVRTRKGFDVKFLADSFGISPGQVSKIYNTWITFLSQELSFLVPWPSKSEVKKCLPKRFKRFENVRIIIDCLELFIQKPNIPSSQKITWSSYKHWNTAKLLVGITPTGVISFIPPLWTGSISDKEIVKQSGLVNLLEEGDAVMADKGFLIRDILAFKKVKLVSPTYCRGPRLTAKGTTHTRRVASLRTHVERNILKLKQFRILSGVIPLLLKPVLDGIVFVCAALTNICKRSIK